MNADTIPAHEAHARLCNAECILKLIAAHMREINGMVDGWQVSEALDGVLYLLDGCYVSLGELLSAMDAGSPGPAATIVHG